MTRQTQLIAVLIGVGIFVTAMWRGGLADDGCNEGCKKVQAWYSKSTHAQDDCHAWDKKTCWWTSSQGSLWVHDGRNHNWVCEKKSPQEENIRYTCTGNCTDLCQDHYKSEKEPPDDFRDEMMSGCQESTLVLYVHECNYSPPGT